jgi:hypothetical protein
MEVKKSILLQQSLCKKFKPNAFRVVETRDPTHHSTRQLKPNSSELVKPAIQLMSPPAKMTTHTNFPVTIIKS